MYDYDRFQRPIVIDDEIESKDFIGTAKKLLEFNIDNKLITLLTGIGAKELSLINSLHHATNSNSEVQIKQELIETSNLQSPNLEAARKVIKEQGIDVQFIEQITGLKINVDFSTVDLTDEKPSTSFQTEMKPKTMKPSTSDIQIDLVSDEEEPKSSTRSGTRTRAAKRIKAEPIIDLDSEDEEPVKKRNKKTEKPAKTAKTEEKKKEKPSTSKKTVKKVKTEPIKTENFEESQPNENLESTSKSKTTKKSTKTLKSLKTDIKFGREEWNDEDLLAEKERVHRSIAKSLIQLFDEGNTVPFIARYRRHLTKDMNPETLRKVKETYDEIVELKTRRSTILNSLEKSGNLDEIVTKSVFGCRSLEELEHVYAPYKPAAKKSLAERAKNLGLQEPAIGMLAGKEIDPRIYIKKEEIELSTQEKVEKNMVHLLGHMIAHDSEVLGFLRELMEKVEFSIHTNLASAAAKGENKDSISKFEIYFDKRFTTHRIQPHQVLAINRGESLKILTVKIAIPDFVSWRFKDFCEKKWMKDAYRNSNRYRLFLDAVKETYSKSVSPYLSRKTRTELKKTAHKASIEVFAKNLKRLLLEPPVKGKVIMGIDPGLKLGCKVAVISPLGDVLDATTIYPHGKQNSDAETIRNLLHKHSCSLIAIGNGKACRETENWLTRLINKDYFLPLNISYTIVEESGASVYSCSEEAKKEFPDMDPLHIGAVSLARRIQDPLAELIKIDPKSLGVGMYQHDLNQKLLDSTLNEVISECVSFVGVDLNTASHCLLRRVAGLSAAKADSILKHRQQKGPFTNRYQVKDVKGIGDKIFEQCSGFLRIIPSNAEEAVKFYERPETTPLDATDIHPEDYDFAEKLILKFGLRYKHIGLPSFIKNFEQQSMRCPVDSLAEEYKTSVQTVKLVISALSKPLAYDLRTENPHGPIFKKDVTRLDDLKPNLVLTGRVTNVVHFGAFVDIGVGQNGLIHTSKMKGKDINVGSRVEVKVLNIDGHKIQLDLLNIL